MTIHSFKLLICCVLLFWGLTQEVNGQVENVGQEKFIINVDGNPLKIPFYANYDLFATNSTIDKAIVVIHGTNRNADEYFENMEVAAAVVSNLTENTLIIAPQFLTETDIDFHGLDAEHLYWSSGGWKSGSNSRNEATNPRPARIPSYAVLDSLLTHLAWQFPNLTSIVLTGHSAGGQVTQRMAATSPITEQLCIEEGIGLRFVVANPSSYVYMDGQRKVANSTTDFAIPTNSCTTYNEWKYGLDDLFTYPKSVGIPTIRAINEKNTITYLLGENDNNPNSSSLDTDCEANLQGDHRLERGLVYFNYLQYYYGAAITENHDLVIVPNAGHNNLDMYNSAEGIEVLFERPTTTCASTVPTQEVLKDLQLTVFPNPTSDVLNFVLPSDFPQQAILSIFDINGRSVLTKNVAHSTQLNTSSLAKGMYILQVMSIEKIVSQRFLID